MAIGNHCCRKPAMNSPYQGIECPKAEQYQDGGNSDQPFLLRISQRRQFDQCRNEYPKRDEKQYDWHGLRDSNCKITCQRRLSRHFRKSALRQISAVGQKMASDFIGIFVSILHCFTYGHTESGLQNRYSRVRFQPPPRSPHSCGFPAPQDRLGNRTFAGVFTHFAFCDVHRCH